MKIKLDFPFNSYYKSGYLAINKEPRRILTLYKMDGTLTSISYARYLMSIHLGRFLLKNEYVDHIDNCKLNDVIENLQILTPRENNIKKLKHLGLESKPISLVCPICKQEFTKARKQLITKLNNGKNPTCSKKCGGKQSYLTKTNKIKQVRVL
ncbi:HNH endonuclease [Elizabethkingia meningoseptica]|uniref:HNH endonuclease n=1 Tax=Elizabethkingia meningoseptica TaxID=238 RepID=UPI00162A265B|nr:HNH endonuclease [Elizabethkingia meningoseptica]HAY3553759.1 HNH endonuclease [Elizabethkingia meningoseptica]